MHNERIRNWVIFSIVFSYVIVSRDRLIFAIFSIWVGAWTMAKTYKYLFNSVKDSVNLTLERFIPDKFIWLGLLSESTRKETFLIIVW